MIYETSWAILRKSRIRQKKNEEKYIYIYIRISSERKKNISLKIKQTIIDKDKGRRTKSGYL